MFIILRGLFKLNKSNEETRRLSDLEKLLITQENVKKDNYIFVFLKFPSDDALENMRNIQCFLAQLVVSDENEINYAKYSFFRNKVLGIMQKSESLFSDRTRSSHEKKEVLDNLKAVFLNGFYDDNNKWVAPSIDSKEVCIAALALLDMIHAIKTLKVNGGSFTVVKEGEDILNSLFSTLEYETQYYQRLSGNQVAEAIENLISSHESSLSYDK